MKTSTFILAVTQKDTIEIIREEITDDDAYVIGKEKQKITDKYNEYKQTMYSEAAAIRAQSEWLDDYLSSITDHANLK